MTRVKAGIFWRNRFAVPSMWWKFEEPPVNAPPWAGGIVVNHAYLAEAEAIKRAEEALRKEEERAREEIAAEREKLAAEREVLRAATAAMRRGAETLPARREQPDFAEPEGEEEELRLQRHRARCLICRHRKLESIERDYLQWVSPEEIARRYRLGSWRAVYRHMGAVGLYEKRGRVHATYRLEQGRRASERTGESKRRGVVGRMVERVSAAIWGMRRG